jgi:hypothetical protein
LPRELHRREDNSLSQPVTYFDYTSSLGPVAHGERFNSEGLNPWPI